MTDPQFTYPRRQLQRKLLRGLGTVALSLLSNFTVIGKENIPQRGPLLIAANHFHFGDPVVLARVLPFPLEFFAGFHRPNAPAIVRWLPELWGVYAVRRGGASRTAMRGAQAVMAQNGVLAIFPEAGSWADVLRPARPGLAYVAGITNAPILPIGIDGMTDLFPKVRQGQRSNVTVRIGQPLGPYQVEGRGRGRRDQLDAIGAEVMRAIAELLPPERHGVFSNDPLLRAEAEKVADFPYEDLIG